MQLPPAMENGTRVLAHAGAYALTIYWLWVYATPEQCAAVIYRIRALVIPATAIISGW